MDQAPKTGNYERITIKGYPYIEGFPKLNPESIYGLSVGELISSIGRFARGGGESSSNRKERMRHYYEIRMPGTKTVIVVSLMIAIIALWMMLKYGI